MTDNSGVSNRFNLEDNLFRIQTGTKSIDESYFFLFLDYYYNSPEASEKEDFNPITKINLVDCDNSTFPKEFIGQFKGGKCIAPGQHIEIVSDNETVGQLMLSMTLCTNGTNPNVTCKSIEDIEKKLSGKTLSFFLQIESERIDHYTHSSNN